MKIRSELDILEQNVETTRKMIKSLTYSKAWVENIPHLKSEQRQLRKLLEERENLFARFKHL